MVFRFRKKSAFIFDESVQHTCLTCENVFHGRFCNRCGEKVLEPREKSLKYFFGSIINALTFLDSKFLKTLRLIIFKPGELSAHYIRGRRIPFIRPISMFFLGNLLYFLFPIFLTFNTTLHIQSNMMIHKATVQRMVDERIQQDQTDYKTFAVKYNQQSENMSKLILIFMVLFFAVPESLVNYSKQRYFSDHLMVSLEFMNFTLFVNTIFLSYLVFGIYTVLEKSGIEAGWILADLPNSILIGITSMYSLVGIARNVYNQRWWVAILKSLALFVGLYLVLTVYRILLFFVTMWTL